MEEEKIYSYGENVCGLNLYQGDDAVENVSRSFADAIDALNNMRNETAYPEIKRLCSAAITQAETAHLWAIKALSFKV